MKLSFTTLGCPEWPLDKIIASAVEYGFDAIDFRGLTGEMNIYKLPEFSESVQKTLSQITDAGLHVSCFSSSVHLFSEENFEKNIQEITEFSKLCSIFGTRYIRVFGGKIGDVNRDTAVQRVITHVSEMAKIAKAHGVKLLIETHDDWIACADMKTVMEQVDTEAVGVLWDVHHPYRMVGEQPEDSWSVLGQWIEYTHVKDSRAGENGGEDFQYCLTGEGDIPLKAIYQLLIREGYQGYFTLEWEKKWHPELDNPEIAFPQYVQYMRKLASEVTV
ncbi:sugar phosphate isomerase/epimerase family protein [Paenibacillus agricola]|uniref:Sugar phosphate isomerase/epimerase n=1 Tax=Paenibacillus agricola TaxID=2716264 RepID=A0ABX0JIE1_9BACL|nr:sugar phosphate isomerase/epimerase family protein [Paenibacillus agricola]NHN35215.1 sugar phosphate isomerase/epimerase [Paenibacillus agricola]